MLTLLSKCGAAPVALVRVRQDLIGNLTQSYSEAAGLVASNS